MILKYIRIVLIVLVIITIVFELTLRFFFGFCNAPLYVEDPDFEYVYAPNQHHYRFRNIVKTNEFGMRSEPVNASDSTIILLIGDSVVNGGSPTDHDELASTILEKKLTSHFNKKIRVLNISAGSWGPDNAYAYLKKKGLFKADLVCLVTSSHDAYDNMSFNQVVGVFTNYPKEQYTFAIYEFYDRYWWMVRYFTNYYIDEFLKIFKSDAAPTPQPSAPKQTNQNPVDSTITLSVNDIIHKFGTNFNKGFQQLYDTTTAMHVPFMIYLHPEDIEIQQNRYDKQGVEIIQFAKKRSIPIVLELEKKPNQQLLYRDQIHYNALGQQYLADQLYPLFVNYLTTKKSQTNNPQ